MPKLSFDISDDILFALNEDEAEFEKGMRLYTAMQLFKEHKLSIGQSSTLAGMNKLDFMRECGKYNIAVIDYDVPELQRELKSFS
jgi:predicted HTH domain antitoxin